MGFQLTQTLELDDALQVASGASCGMSLDVLTWDDIDMKLESGAATEKKKPI